MNGAGGAGAVKSMNEKTGAGELISQGPGLGALKRFLNIYMYEEVHSGYSQQDTCHSQ